MSPTPRDQFRENYYKALRARRAMDEKFELERVQNWNDAKIFFLLSAGFFLAGVVATSVSNKIVYTGPGFNPAEVMSVFLYSAAGVLGFWSFVKYTQC